MLRGLIAKRWFAGGGVVVCAGLFAARTAGADTPALTLDWAAPAGCPGQGDLRAGAERLLGGPIEPRLAHPLVMHGRVAVAGERLVLDLETVDDGIRGERTLYGATCEELTSAAALILALAVDPKAVAAHSATAGPLPSASTASPAPPADAAPPPVVVPPPVVAAPPSVPPSPPGRPPRESSPVHVTARADAALVGELGALPGPTLGAELGATIGVDRFRLRPSVAYYAPRFASANDPARPTSGGDVSLLVGALAGCYAITVGSPELDGCVAMEGGALFAVGRDFDSPKDASPPWLAAGAAVDLVVPVVGPVAVRISVGAMVPFGRSQVRFSQNTGNVQQMQEIHRPWFVSGRAALGVCVAFW